MSLHDIAGPAVAVSPERAANQHFFYLPQSFPGIVWHQQLLEVDAAAVGVAGGRRGGGRREQGDEKREKSKHGSRFQLRLFEPHAACGGTECTPQPVG